MRTSFISCAQPTLAHCHMMVIIQSPMCGKVQKKFSLESRVSSPLPWQHLYRVKCKAKKKCMVRDQVQSVDNDEVWSIVAPIVDKGQSVLVE